ALPESAAGSFVAEGVGRLQDYARERRATVLAIGPGLTTGPDAEAFVLRALRTTLPAVVDADALNILARRGPRAATSRAPRVFTPHPGEAARLLGSTVSAVESDRPGSAARLARRLGGVVLLKGRGTVIASGSALAVNSTGGPGLAKGGSGDVLAGLIAGLWAQMLASGRTTCELPFRAAALGAWLHGKAGELAEEALTPWAMTPADVVERLPAAFKALSA
ncbi:MAG: NAD(P)H-hydrate dehydratase, partial [Elusimicrobia bacterium]|nr:NAD(P)H-hydrate dehydratase [Elusimicrobiota bacterium]